MTRLNAGGQGVAEVQLVNLVKGDRVLALDQNARPLFAKVEALPHGPSAEPFVHISMAGKEKCDLKITLHHTFDACASDQNPFKHAVEQFGGIAIKAKNIKRGDCLHTADGRRKVHTAERFEFKDGDTTFSIKLTGNILTVAIGGVFTHAMGHPQLLSHTKHPRRMHDKKKTAAKSTKMIREP